MNTFTHTFCLVFFLCFVSITRASTHQTQSFHIENRHLSRILQVTEEGQLLTHSIINKDARTLLTPLSCDEFSFRYSIPNTTDKTDYTLSSKDFKVISWSVYNSPLISGSKGYKFKLAGRNNGFTLTIYYEIGKNDAYCRKHIEITSDRDIQLKRVNIEAISFKDALQNYSIKQINAQGSGQWRPGLGQPIYTTQTGTFWGTEFPAAINEVVEQQINCGYLWGQILAKNTLYTSYNSVIGVSDNPKFIDDAFYAYINNIRIRPSRLQVQYNSWFDYYKGVSKEKFAYSTKRINEELVLKRGCAPLNAYVIDDGWQDAGKQANWSDTVWKTNTKFQPKFDDCFNTVKEARSHLGLWLSPASILGGLPMVPKMRDYGFEALSYGMSMTGEKYMQKLEERILELAGMGVSYFKFDGLFGHLNIRDFSLPNNPYPSSNDKRLDVPQYDEQKSFYLSAGTERLMQIFHKLHLTNPEIFIAITNGAYLSPWWLQYVDIVWLINAGDAAKGNNRTGELVYRDQVYHQIWKKENTKFPMCAIFNHEPKKTSSNETEKSFKDYLFMNLSRGTGFIELYIKTDSLSNKDWDILADGLKWAEKTFPTFNNVRMLGGEPQANDIYGYTAWNYQQGYISLHNPSNETKNIQIKLDRTLGLHPTKKIFKITSPLGNIPIPLNKSYKYGDILSVNLSPAEIIILDFYSKK